MKVTDKIELYNCDNMELMAKYPDNYFDLAIVDPPYGIDADVKNSQNKVQTKKSATKSKKYGSQLWDSDIPSDEYFDELKRVMVHGVLHYCGYKDKSDSDEALMRSKEDEKMKLFHVEQNKN